MRLEGISALAARRQRAERRAAGRAPGARLGAVALAAGLLLVAGCGGGDGDGETSAPADAASATDLLGPAAPASGEPIRIGLVSDGKGGLIDLSIEEEVAKATATYLNQHRSGIGGRPIEIVTCESMADPGKSVDCANRMIEEKVTAVVVGAVASMETVWEPLHEAGLPVMFYSGGGTGLLRDADSTFTLSDQNAGTIQFPLQVAKDNGASKVTAIVIDVPAATNVLKNLAPAVYEKAGIGFELVAIPPSTADMTPQMQSLVADDPGVVFILGSDAFCISALNGLHAVGFSGKITGIAQCVTDATREAVPGEVLEGMMVTAPAPIGTDNPSTRLYSAVASTFGKDIDTSRAAGMNTFILMAGLQAASEGITGDITPASLTAAIKAMPEKELPGAGGLKFRCDGKAVPETPAVCVRGGLAATLDDQGRPSEYQVVGATS